MTIPAQITASHADMTRWRHDIHAHPELGFNETRTADLVATQLESFGIQVHRGIGKTGVVGVLKNGNSARTIGLRADMDALPITEANEFAHRSTNAGVMHACGHDGHTTMLLGAAQYLASTRLFDGTVNFIFQPAEEGLGGASAMIADGLFDRFPCDSIFGMHNRPKLAVGKFAVHTAGPAMAGGAFFDIRIEGVGAHGARPDSGVDALLIATQITNALQSIVSRNVPPLESAVLSVTQIHSGDAYNVIPQVATLAGTVRAFSDETMQMIENNMTRIVQNLAKAMGATATVDFRVTFVPTINDVAQAEFAADVCEQLVGVDNVNRSPNLIPASEDFSFMLREIPGCYLFIGNGDVPGSCEVHNPGYDFNDDALPLGAGFFAQAVHAKLPATA